MSIWIGEIALSWAALFAVQIPLRRKPHPVARTVVYCVKLVLIPLAAFYFVAVDSVVPYTHGDLVCAVYIALIGDVLSSSIEYAVRRMRSATCADGDKLPCMQGVVAVLSLLACVAVAAYGEFRYPGTLLYVSAGESGWMMPLRTEEHCEWDLITLTP